jgi:hypothetical protein
MIRVVRKVVAAATCVVLGALAAPAGAAIVNVNCATQNLQNRIDAAPAGSTLKIKGTCVGQFTVAKNLTLAGNPKATLDGNGAGRPLTIAGTPTVALVDLRVTGGLISGTDAFGGGIHHAGGLLTLRRTVVAGNVADATGAGVRDARGGGIYSAAGTIRLYNSTVSGNEARGLSSSSASSGSGGGIFHTGNLLLEDSRVNDNRARAETPGGGSGASSTAGGIDLIDGTLTMRRSHVDRNRATATGTGPATYSAAAGGGLYLESATAITIQGSTVSANRAVASLVGGTVQAFGGGIHATGNRATIRASALAGNIASAGSTGGAGAEAWGGALNLGMDESSSIVGSRITGSKTTATTGGTARAWGGGLYLGTDSVTLRRSLVAANAVTATGGTGSAAAEGGGLFAESPAVGIGVLQSTVRGNRAGSSGPGGAVSHGGGVASRNGIVRVTASTLNANVADSAGQALGGGVYLNSGGPHAVESSTLAGNRASGQTARGGAIDVDTTLAVTAATVARNSARIGGGIYVEGGTTTLRATILALNTATMSGPNCSQNVASAGRNLVASVLGCAFASLGTDKTGLAAKIGPLRSNGGPTQTVALLAGSPALNAIPKGECPFFRDQRGVRRPQPKNGRCDIGAYERRP